MVKKVYISKGCPACKETKKRLKGRKGLRYIDVDKHPDKAEHIRAVPTLEHEDGSLCVGADAVVACTRKKR